MARVQYQGKTYNGPEQVAMILGEYNIPYEHWGVKTENEIEDEKVLDLYQDEIDQLKSKRGYKTADLIALTPRTPNLETIVKKFDKEHHHAADEVRFTVAGEGVFEIVTDGNENIKFTAEPGDLIVIPADQRHLFYLTAKKSIRCIRLFKNTDGWEAIY